MSNKIKNIILYVLVFILLFLVCAYVNKALVIKGLYKDDLYNWSWFPGMKIFDFSFGFYSETRYRPFFNLLQYIEYMIVSNNPIRFTYINYIFNTILSLFIFHFSKKLKAGNIVSFLMSIMFLLSHFSYYQIGQAFGLLETEAQLFALIILYLCFKLVGIVEKRNNILIIIFIYIMYFIIAFTHERYLCLAPVIILSFLFADYKLSEKKPILKKFFLIIILFIEIVIIAIIRYIAVGKVLPAGTGGTYVEDTFNMLTCIKNCFTELLFIFGINIGPEHLVGIDFFSINKIMIKYFAYISIASIIVIFAIYLIVKINAKKEYDKFKSFIPDLLFITFIVMCIGATSVTIRIEMRFIYTSFTACLLYLSYACGYINVINKFIPKIFMIIFVLAFFITRNTLELEYRLNYKRVHCIVDQQMMNSLYDNTIGKYGVDDILHNKKIYILKNVFGMTDFYASEFYKIFDKKNIGNKIIIIDDITMLPEGTNSTNSIVLYEDMENNAYKSYNIG